MSLEVWGDEGNVPETWADTAICQEFSNIRDRLLIWARIHKNYFPNQDFEVEVKKMIDASDEISEQMQGKL